MYYGGDDDETAEDQPTEPGELDLPEGMETLLGSEQEEDENKNLL
jgi:hypothetical protein